jgi:hypothetical protein
MAMCFGCAFRDKRPDGKVQLQQPKRQILLPQRLNRIQPRRPSGQGRIPTQSPPATANRHPLPTHKREPQRLQQTESECAAAALQFTRPKADCKVLSFAQTKAGT